jgi:S1-C subfamily serine protease
MQTLFGRFLLPFLPSFLLGAWAHAEDVAAVYDRVAPSVVEIRGEQIVMTGTGQKRTTTITSQGSGVLVTRDGKVITAAHLVQSADAISVHTGAGESVAARVIASEPAADVALLQLEQAPADAKAAALGNSDAVQIGDPVLLVGAPYGLHPTLTVGHIGGRHDSSPPFGAFEPAEILQTDAGMHHGSSGSPMFNAKGEVVGIATRVMSTHGHYEGLGFTIAANTARALLLERRSLWSGVECYWLSGALAQALNLPQSAGMLVQRIASHSPGSRLGLQAGTAAAVVGEEKFILGGDVILAMQGISLAEERGYERARAALADLKDGDTLHFTVLRAGKQVELRAPLVR